MTYQCHPPLLMGLLPACSSVLQGGLTLGVSACQTWRPELQAHCQPANAGWGLWTGTQGLMEQGSKEGTVSCSMDGASCGAQASPHRRERAAPETAQASPRT